jgi:hypothetical protein
MLRLASDADVHGDIVRGLRRRLRELDLVRVQGALPEGTPDPEVLAWACGVECVYLDWKGRIVQIVLKNAHPVLAEAIRIFQDRFDELEYVELVVALEELADAVYKAE